MTHLQSIQPGVVLGLLATAACVVLCASGARAARPAKPISLHPDNGHYFLWRSNPTILITSGEHYGALLNLDFDYRRYFKALAADGLNHTRVFAGTYREVPSSFGITDNPLAPKPNRYICPWARTKTAGYFAGGGKFDLTQWDPAYFDRLGKLMAAARDAGIVVELTLFCPLYGEELWEASPMHHANNVNGIGACPRKEVLTLKHKDLLAVQLAFVRKVVGELKDFDNLYYEVCNEPYIGGVTWQWQHRVIDEIVRAEAKLPKGRRHLISLNVANGRKKVARPHKDVSIYNFHYCVPPNTVAMNYGLAKVIGENETGGRGPQDVLYRTECWDFLIAGGGLYNNLDYSFTPAHPDGTFIKHKSPGGGSPALRKQLRICKDFLYGLDYIRMKPDNDVIVSVSGELSARALAERGKAYAVYMHVPLPNKPKPISKYLRKGVQAAIALEMPAGAYRAQWIDTKSGKVAKTETFDHGGGQRKLASPTFDNDIALRVTAR